MPTKSQLAKLNSLNYNLADGDKKQQKKATKKIGKMGYEIASTSRGITHLKSSKEDDKHHVVVVKGTNPSNVKDLMSDFKLGIGKSGTDKQFKHRQKKVKKIYEGIGDEDKHLTGHSLGGSGVSSMMAKSKSIRENTKTATAFNTGMTPAFNAELQKDLKKEDKKELKQKLVHHHVRGDPISAALTIGTQVGKVKTTKAKAASPHSLDNHHADKSLKDKAEPVAEEPPSE